jgi:hypothetical protein
VRSRRQRGKASLAASQPLSPQASLSAILAYPRFMSYQNCSSPLPSFSLLFFVRRWWWRPACILIQLLFTGSSSDLFFDSLFLDLGARLPSHIPSLSLFLSLQQRSRRQDCEDGDDRVDHGNGGGSPWRTAEGVTVAALRDSGRKGSTSEQPSGGGIDRGSWTRKRAAVRVERQWRAVVLTPLHRIRIAEVLPSLQLYLSLWCRRSSHALARILLTKTGNSLAVSLSPFIVIWLTPFSIFLQQGVAIQEQSPSAAGGHGKTDNRSAKRACKSPGSTMVVEERWPWSRRC